MNLNDNDEDRLIPFLGKELILEKSHISITGRVFKIFDDKSNVYAEYTLVSSKGRYYLYRNYHDYMDGYKVLEL